MEREETGDERARWDQGGGVRRLWHAVRHHGAQPAGRRRGSATRPRRSVAPGATSSCNIPGCAACRANMYRSDRSPRTRSTMPWNCTASPMTLSSAISWGSMSRSTPMTMRAPASKTCAPGGSRPPSCRTVRRTCWRPRPGHRVLTSCSTACCRSRVSASTSRTIGSISLPWIIWAWRGKKSSSCRAMAGTARRPPISASARCGSTAPACRPSACPGPMPPHVKSLTDIAGLLV